jgi:Peptidase family M50
MLYLVLGLFFSTLVHESGHAFAAWVCGWKVILFVVRPFGFQIPNRDLAIVPSQLNEHAGGWVSSVPGGPDVDTDWRWATIIVAGPIADLLLAIAALLVGSGVVPLTEGNGTVGNALGFGLALQALYGTLFSLLPGERPGGSDGDILRALARGDGDWPGRPVTWQLGLLGNNVRLSAVPEWLMAQGRAAAQTQDWIARHMAGLEIGRVLDSAPVDASRARALIEDFRGRYGTDGWLAACDAWLAATWEDRVDSAKSALDAPQNGPGVPELTMAAEAMIAARTGETERARVLLREMMATVKEKSPFRNPTFQDLRRQVEVLLP